MVRATMMSKQQIAELVEIARRDHTLWAALKDRELDQFNQDGSVKIPSISILVEDFVKERCGASHNYAIGSLIVALRLPIRQELGLPA
ncbi:hypothetical protein J6500_13640 [Bradyrhizobium sp. WSM 1704]|uniref:hypothetical protein n=1 Tax=Bradyrhizobium semiaridum TaxID=2821404 RepID=UPI001CE3A532|nr:hypothetical protein [Bradyrhizobium semiaridum]MCA6122932.1 hypothetical protein [Bradyrhizobium semiaridum]